MLRGHREERASVQPDQPANRPTTDSQPDRPIDSDCARQPYPRPAGRSLCNPRRATAGAHTGTGTCTTHTGKKQRASAENGEEAIIQAHDACRRQKRNRSACIWPAISMPSGMFLRSAALACALPQVLPSGWQVAVEQRSIICCHSAKSRLRIHCPLSSSAVSCRRNDAMHPRQRRLSSRLGRVRGGRVTRPAGSRVVAM